MTTPRFTLDLAAWDAGFEAGFATEYVHIDQDVVEVSSACPYPVQSRESLSWHAGYIEGKASRQGV